MNQPVASFARQPALTRIRQYLLRSDAETLSLQAQLSAIPAPTGAEVRRADFVAGVMRDIGLSPVERDDAGNVIAWLGQHRNAGDGTGVPDSNRRRGSEGVVLVAAHLDTVFAAGVDVSVRRDGRRLAGPGISDNARGLAGMLALGRALAQAEWRADLPIALAATVGEEGAGDLRGMRHLFHTRGLAAAAVIALDGAGDDRVVHRAVGSRRFRFTYRGPGGHSWSAFGVANPAHAAGLLAAAVSRMNRTPEPRTACSVVRLSGGEGLNSIPREAWIEIDLRSESQSAITAVEAALAAHAAEALAWENTRRAPGSPPATLACELIGDRPSGSTPVTHPLVQAGIDATRHIGREPALAAASTDANVPIALGIPAIAMGAGGRSGDAHLPTEWYDNVDGPLGLFRAALVLAAVAGVR